jgi:Flp pilus assembly protein TadG
MGSKGTVTVFMVLITTVTFVFAGLIIDMSRILLANYAASSAIESATRSLMANYNKDLVADYGLYAIEKCDSNDKLFMKYLIRNLNLTDKNNGAEKTFTVLKTRSDNLVESETSVEYTDQLINDDVFKAQLTEYMKYRAPIIWADETISKFMDILTDKVSGAMLGKAKEASDKTKEAKKAAKELKEQIRTTKQRIISEKPHLLVKVVVNNIWKDSVKRFADQVINKSVTEIASLLWDGFEEATLGEYGNFDATFNEINSRISEFERSLEDTKNQLDALEIPPNDAADYKDDVSAYMEDYSDFADVKNRVKIIESNINTAKEIIKNNKTVFKAAAQDEKALKTIICAFALYKEGCIGQDAYNLAFSSSLTKITDNEIKSELQSLSINMTQVNFEKKVDELCSSCIDKMNGAINAIANINIEDMLDYKAPGDVKDNYKNKDEQDTQETNISNSLDNLKTGLDLLWKDISPYELTKYNPNGTDGTFIKHDDLLDKAKETISLIEQIKNSGFAYNFFLTTYIMDKTNYLTSTTRRNHFFNFGETEYIISGRKHESAGVLQVVGEVSLIRAVINFVYYFVFESPPAAEGVSLLVKIGYSAVRAVIKTAADMFNMIVLGKDIAISPNLEILKVSYRDHLTFLVFLTVGKQQSLINTMQATLKSNDALNGTSATGVDMRNLYTTVQTTVTVKCDLIFLSLFGFSHIDRNIVENGYKIKKTILYTY